MPLSSRLIALLLVGLVAASCDRQKAEAPQAEPVAAGEEEATGKGVDRSHKGEAAPSVEFNNPDGGTFDLTKFKGSPVLVNLWASWCAPCIKELPTLQKLEEAQAQGRQARRDRGQPGHGAQGVGRCLPEGQGQSAASPPITIPDMKLSCALGVQIMPTTILYDADGKEVWRYTGDLDWTGAEAAKLLSEAAPPKS